MLFRMLQRVDRQAEQRGAKVQVYTECGERRKGENFQKQQRKKDLVAWLLGWLVGWFWFQFWCKWYGICMWSVCMCGVICVWCGMYRYLLVWGHTCSCGAYAHMGK